MEATGTAGCPELPPGRRRRRLNAAAGSPRDSSPSRTHSDGECRAAADPPPSATLDAQPPPPDAGCADAAAAGAAAGCASHAADKTGALDCTIASLRPPCQFCGSNESDELRYGQLLTAYGLTVHYFCMLFSSALVQGGRDDEGIFGFMPEDIMKEIRRGRKLKCCYCRRFGATVGCVTRKCRRAFHFGCGKSNGALNQYFNTYSTFCSDHRPQQSVPVAPSDRLSFHGLGMASCPICTCSVETRVSDATLRSPCCASSGNAWYHRDCIQRMALSSGLHFIRCPLCNDKERFIDEMLQFGIYIPDRDASWEVETGAYADLHTSHDRCDVQPRCECPHGRDFKGGEGSPWEIFLCMSCGGGGIHLACYEGVACSQISVVATAAPLTAVSAASRSRSGTSNRKRECSPPAVTWNCSDCATFLLKSGLECDRMLRSHFSPKATSPQASVVVVQPSSKRNGGRDKERLVKADIHSPTVRSRRDAAKREQPERKGGSTKVASSKLLSIRTSERRLQELHRRPRLLS